jgi:hypothetical protein
MGWLVNPTRVASNPHHVAPLVNPRATSFSNPVPSSPDGRVSCVNLAGAVPSQSPTPDPRPTKVACPKKSFCATPPSPAPGCLSPLRG